MSLTPDNIRKSVPVKAVINIENDDFYTRVASTYDIGCEYAYMPPLLRLTKHTVAEAFMVGDFTTPDIRAVLSIIKSNLTNLANLQTTWARVYSMTTGVLNRYLGHTRLNSMLSCVTAYDTSNALFEAFLDKTMTYSCYIWDTSTDGGPRGDFHQSLSVSADEAMEAAASRKLHYMLAQARVQPGDRVLEFGSGWGSMALEAASMGCKMHTLTLSIEQKKLAEARIAAKGFADLVNVHLLDFRDLKSKFPEFKHAFDAFVCSEMFEHVGEQHHAEFFQILDWALKPQNSAICMSATTQPENRYSVYQAEDFIRRYQWPNVLGPSATSLAQAIQAAVPHKFVLQGVVDHGMHYSRTLREWGRRLERNWTPELIIQIQEEQPQLRDKAALAAFKRKWEYTFAYAEVGFARAYTSCHCWTFVRPVSHRPRRLWVTSMCLTCGRNILRS